MKLHTPTSICCASGYLDYLNPDTGIFDIHTLATGLAKETRFAGQADGFWSVALHSVLVSRIVPPEFALEGLLHDASEAVAKDLPRPLKNLLGEYKVIERGIDRIIRARYGLPLVASDCVKLADNIALVTEKRDLMPWDDIDWTRAFGYQWGVDDERIKPLPYTLQSKYDTDAHWSYGYRLFLDRYWELRAGLQRAAAR